MHSAVRPSNLRSGITGLTILFAASPPDTWRLLPRNHNFAADPDSVSPECSITHVNLNDGTVEGMVHRTLPVFSVQSHPRLHPDRTTHGIYLNGSEGLSMRLSVLLHKYSEVSSTWAPPFFHALSPHPDWSPGGRNTAVGILLFATSEEIEPKWYRRIW